MKFEFVDLVAVVGLAAIAQGIWQFSPPAAIIFSGIALVCIALVLGAGKRKDQGSQHGTR